MHISCVNFLTSKKFLKFVKNSIFQKWINCWSSTKTLFILESGEESSQPITEEYVEEAQIETCLKEIEKLETEPLIRESKNKNYDDPLDQIFQPIQKEIKDHLSGRVLESFFRSEFVDQERAH